MHGMELEGLSLGTDGIHWFLGGKSMEEEGKVYI